MRRSYTLILAVLFTLSLNVVASGQSREQILNEIAAKRTELADLEKQYLSPSEADRTAFAEFLTQPGTGLIRLLPREKFESETYSKNRRTITMRGGGAYYSFSRLTHEYGYGSDIELASGYLSVGGFGGASYGMFIKLGDVALDELSTKHPGVFSLQMYLPAEAEPAARVEQRRVSEGTTIDGLLFKRRLPLELNATYVLRSIDYYDHSDVLVGFRTVRQDSDGSIIIAWKLLEKNPVPELKRPIASQVAQD